MITLSKLVLLKLRITMGPKLLELAFTIFTFLYTFDLSRFFLLMRGSRNLAKLEKGINIQSQFHKGLDPIVCKAPYHLGMVYILVE